MLKISLLILGSFALAACGKGMQAMGSGNESSLEVNSTPFVLGALGDSITRGMDIHDLAVESPDESWATGSKLPGSLENKLRAAFAAEGVAHTYPTLNLAVSGSSVLGSASVFGAQVDKMAASAPDIVTIEMGSNDLCQGHLSGTGAALLRDRMITHLNTLKNSAHPPKVIALLSVPHVFALTQNATFAASPVCQAAWSLMCPNLSIGQTQFEAQWSAGNQALSDAAAAVGGTVVFDGGAVAASSFSTADVSSIDCFHPSVQGQTKLAELIWPLVQGAL